MTVFSATALFLLVSSVAARAQLERVPNTTLQLPQEPPAFGFRFSPAFGRNSFSEPVAIVSPPGENNRLFVVERDGRIIVIPNLGSPSKVTFLDISGKVETDNYDTGLLSMAFHPDYSENGYFFVWYTAQDTQPNRFRNILARYSVSPDNPDQALPDSELILINQFDVYPDHNGGDLHFGPDRYLYLSLGDGGVQSAAGYDRQLNSQRIDGGFFSGMIRIDVDNREGNLPPNSYNPPSANYPEDDNTIGSYQEDGQTVWAYSIPADNPFIGATSFNGSPVDPDKVRTEFWAVGLRNPFRFSFDDDSGLLYLGDVGQVTYEEINIIEKGGNYGWVFREGTELTNVPGGPDREVPAEFEFIDPIYQYSWGTGPTQGKTVIGGVVYRGNQFSQLYGHYVFGEHIEDKVWAFKYENGAVSNFREIASLTGVVAFGTDPSNGDLLAASIETGFVYRLVYNTGEMTGEELPQTLADTGAFSDLMTLTANPGIVPYDINVPFWSDHAIKSRWVSVPDVDQTIGFDPVNNWSFPTGTVWIKHFDLEMTNGVPASAKRLETRFIVRNEEGVYGLTYRWGDSTENAQLVPEEGMNEEFTIYSPDGSVLRDQTWRYPGRVECLVCHTPAGGFGLGFNTAQLNRDHDYEGGVANQVQALSDAGYFETQIQDTGSLLALARASDESASLEWRVRSYLSSNCVQCHQPAGVPSHQAHWDARISTPLDQTGIIDGILVKDFGIPENKVVKPGSLDNSVLYARVAELGEAHMPPLATSVLNEEAIALLAAWIGDSGPSFKIAGAGFDIEGKFSFTIQGPPGSEVTIQSKTDLSDTMWNNEVSDQFDSEGLFLFTDSDLSSSSNKYYQAVTTQQ